MEDDIMGTMRMFVYILSLCSIIADCSGGLMVEFGPVIDFSDVVFRGENIFLRCDVTGAMQNETPAILISRNNVLLFERTSTNDITMQGIGEHQEFQVSKFEITLVFAGVQVSDAGNYTCTAAVQSDIATEQFTLRVETTWPQCVSKCENGDLRHLCYAPRAPNYAMYWEQSSDGINFVIFTQFQPFERDARLVGLSNNGSLDQGYSKTYRCSVTLYSLQHMCTFPNISDCMAHDTTSKVDTEIMFTSTISPSGATHITGNFTRSSNVLNTDMTGSRTTLHTQSILSMATSQSAVSTKTEITEDPGISSLSLTYLDSITTTHSARVGSTTGGPLGTDMNTGLLIGILGSVLVAMSCLIHVVICVVRSGRMKRFKQTGNQVGPAVTDHRGTQSSAPSVVASLSQSADDEMSVDSSPENKTSLNGRNRDQLPSTSHESREEKNQCLAESGYATNLSVIQSQDENATRCLGGNDDVDTYASIDVRDETTIVADWKVGSYYKGEGSYSYQNPAFSRFIDGRGATGSSVIVSPMDYTAADASDDDVNVRPIEHTEYRVVQEWSRPSNVEESSGVIKKNNTTGKKGGRSEVLRGDGVLRGYAGDAQSASDYSTVYKNQPKEPTKAANI